MKRIVTAAICLAICLGAAPAQANTHTARPTADVCGVLSDRLSDAVSKSYLMQAILKRQISAGLSSDYDDFESDPDYIRLGNEVTQMGTKVKSVLTKALRVSKNSQNQALIKSGLRYADDETTPNLIRVIERAMRNVDIGKC